MGSLTFMLIVEAIALPFFCLLFNLPLFLPQLALIAVLATIGFAAVGTLFSAVAANTRAREIMLPILFLPVVVPVIIAAVQASALALAGGMWASLAPYLQLMGAFAVIFVVVSFLTFSFVIEE